MATHRLPNNKRGRSRLAKPAKDRVVNIFKAKPLYPFMMLCLTCGYVGFRLVRLRDIKQAPCSHCRSRKSFPSFIPREYYKVFLEEYGPE